MEHCAKDILCRGSSIMHLSRKSAKSATVSFLSWAPLLRMMSALMGRAGAMTVTSRTVVCPGMEKKKAKKKPVHN